MTYAFCVYVNVWGSGGGKKEKSNFSTACTNWPQTQCLVWSFLWLPPSSVPTFCLLSAELRYVRHRVSRAAAGWSWLWFLPGHRSVLLSRKMAVDDWRKFGSHEWKEKKKGKISLCDVKWEQWWLEGYQGETNQRWPRPCPKSPLVLPVTGSGWLKRQGLPISLWLWSLPRSSLVFKPVTIPHLIQCLWFQHLHDLGCYRTPCLQF